MKITLSGVGKKYINQEIFSGVNKEFTGPGAYLIEGGNGSGKSTFLRCLSGLERISDGTISWENQGAIKIEECYANTAICAPSIQVYDELEITELFNLVKRFKPVEIEKAQDFVSLIGLPKKQLLNKSILSFSSGMRQRVKLAICLIQKVPFIFLDEPCSNLDTTAIAWYNQLVEDFGKEKLIFVASNNPSQEALFCKPGFSLNA